MRGHSAFLMNSWTKSLKGFRRSWCAPLIHLLTQLSPYMELVALRENLGTLSPEFANWYALKEAADGARRHGRASGFLTKYESELSSRESDPIAPGDLTKAVKECEALKKKRGLAFAVVFQRALVLAYLQFTKITRQMIEDLAPITEVEINDDGGLDGDESDEESAEHGTCTGLCGRDKLRNCEGTGFSRRQL